VVGERECRRCCKGDRWERRVYIGKGEGRLGSGAGGGPRTVAISTDGTLLSAVAAFLAAIRRPTTSKIQVQRSTTAGSARLSFFSVSLPTILHDEFFVFF
jgi:hypothetical protein